MSKILLRSGKILFRTFIGILLFLSLYFIVAGICCCIPANRGFSSPDDGILIAVTSNGVHTDILVPAQNELYNWKELLPYSDTKSADSTYGYVSFGWGDKGFYIETPTWADLKASTAFKAMFWMSTSAMHVTWRKKIPATGPRCRSFRISRENYIALCAYIRASFEEKNGRAQYVNAPTYTSYDAFYDAKGRYNLFRTCNVWTGQALKAAGIRVAPWTPFEKSVYVQLP